MKRKLGNIFIKYQMTCKWMPNQFEGTINGVDFYYRARHRSYELIIFPWTDNEKIIDEGESKHAGWWEIKASKRRLFRSLYRAHSCGMLPK